MPTTIYGRSQQQIFADRIELTRWILQFAQENLPWFKVTDDGLYSTHDKLNRYIHSEQLSRYTNRQPLIAKKWGELSDFVRELM